MGDWLLRGLCATALLLLASLARATTCPVDPANPAGDQQWCGCPTSANEAGQASAIDLSNAVTPELIDAAKAKGVTTIMRYYDWPHEPDEPSVKLERQEVWRRISSTCQSDATCGKVVTKAEIDVIHAAGLSVVVIFQHFMSDWDTWLDRRRPDYDVARALELAAKFGQPKGTAIYFGVDGADQNFIEHGDPTGGMAHIAAYFASVKKKLDDAGYKLGVYGSGLVCRKLVDEAALAQWCWLSLSTGHPESKAREASGAWTIKQCRWRAQFLGTTSEVDPDIVKAPGGEFGQWRP